MTLEQFFISIGYNISSLTKSMRDVDLYASWYNGIVESFHKYYVFNGDKKIHKTRYSMNLPKKICENFADLIMNTKTSITISNDRSSEELSKIFDANNFYVKANQAIEKTFAMGLGAFLLSLDKNLGIKIQFVDAKNIIPLTFDNYGISECAFVSDETSIDGDQAKYVQVHRLDSNNCYVINNYKFVVGKSGDLTQINSDEIAKDVKTNSSTSWYSILKPNVVNNLDLESPFGLPIFANALDTIKSLDIIYDSFVNEIQNGRKRLFVTSEALKVNSSGQLSHAFDPNDVVFYLLEGNFSNDNKYVQEVNGDLRINELSLALQTNLEILSMKLGLGRDYYRLGETGVERTATEVVAANSDLFRTIHKHEILVKSCLSNFVKAIQEVAKNYFSLNIDGDIFVDFDDSVIESDSALREQDRLDVAMGVMPLSEYRSKWYGEDIETAREMISLANIERLSQPKEVKEVD